MSAGNFFQSPRGARGYRPLGFIGQFVRSHDFRSYTGLNSDPQAKQVTTVGIPAAPTNSATYTVSVDGVVATYVADASATQAEVGAGLEAAINATAGARAKVIASFVTATLTLTGVWPGVAFVVAHTGGTAGGVLTGPTTTTTAASADVVNFGRVVISAGQVTDEGVPLVVVPVEASFTAQVISHTFVGASTSSYSGIIKFNGREYNWQADFNTNLDTTVGDIVTAINNAVPAESITPASVGGGGGVLTLTSELLGVEFESSCTAAGHTTAAVSKAYTTPASLATSLARAYAGVSVRREDVENQTIDGDDPAYAANEGVEYADRGLGVLQRDTTETWARGDETYVSVATATKGRIYNTAGTDRIWLPAGKITIDRHENSDTTDGIGIVRLGA